MRRVPQAKAASPMAHSVANWLRWRKFAYTVPGSVGFTQGAKSAARSRCCKRPIPALSAAAATQAHTAARHSTVLLTRPTATKPSANAALAQLINSGCTLGEGPNAKGLSQGSTKTTASATAKPRLAGGGEGEESGERFTALDYPGGVGRRARRSKRIERQKSHRLRGGGVQ